MAVVKVILLAVCTLVCAGRGICSPPSAECGSGPTLKAPAPAECAAGTPPLFIPSPQLTPPVQATSLKVRDSCLRSARLASKFASKPTASPLALRALLTEKEEQEDMWLEEIDSEKALSWVKERNEETLQALGNPNDSELQQRILKILDSKDKIPYVSKRGKYLYNLWTDDVNPRGLWRRTTMEEFEKSEPAWETMLDVDALGKEEGESWVWGGTTRPDLGAGVEATRLLVSLSRGGSDAAVTREFCLETKQFIPPEQGGFCLPEAKSSVEYRGADELLVGTDTGPGSLTTSGYPRQVRLWKRGTGLAEAEVVFEGEEDDVSAVSFVSRHANFRYEWRQRATSFYTSKYWVRRLPLPSSSSASAAEPTAPLPEQQGWAEVPVPEGAVVSTMGSQMLVKLREAWRTGGGGEGGQGAVQEHAAGSLIAADLAQVLKLGDKAQFTVLFEPSERCSLSGWSQTRGHLVLSLLDTVKTRLRLWRWHEDAGAWEDAGSSPEAGAIETLSLWALDEDAGDQVWLMSSSYTSPPSLAILDLAAPGALSSGRRELKRLPPQFDAHDLHTTQHHATSRDGTEVPYFVVSRKGMKRDGTNPALVYAYGGFEVSLTPSYGAVVGAAWLEKGGAYVVANIRGGGEFGPEWHRAALREKRQAAFDDLFAVCTALIADGVTSPARLGMRGGSNGGLLAGNALVQRSDLLGAVVGEVPLLDMRRFHKLLAGSSWIAEYGDPDVEEDWQYLKGYSPYHRIDREKRYAPVLFTTSTRDDRVHPGHARKMVRRLRDTPGSTLYYENIEGGHGGAADNKQRAFMQTLVYSFLWQQLGSKPASD